MSARSPRRRGLARKIDRMPLILTDREVRKMKLLLTLSSGTFKANFTNHEGEARESPHAKKGKSDHRPQQVEEEAGTAGTTNV